MNNNIGYTLLGVLIGLAVAGLFANYAVNNQNQGMMRMMGMRGSMMQDDYNDKLMPHAMREMMAGLEGRTGDAFDKAFIAGMIEHHEGAIEMAESALKNAKHQEIKDLAKAIIEAQSKEITQMKVWEAAWYK